MLKSIEQITQSATNLTTDLAKYDISNITNLAVLSKVKKAWLEASKYITNEQEAADCKLQFYGSLQKLKRIGIDLNDLDCWFINSYKSKIEAQYQYQALLRSAAKKGYICSPTIYYLLPEEVGLNKETGQPKNFYTTRDENNAIRIHYTNYGLKKEINLNTIKDFHSFFILMNISDKKGRMILSQELFLTPEEILERKEKSKTKDSGSQVFDYKSKTYVKKEEKSVWEQWTRQQIDKTLVWAAMKLVKESLPVFDEFLNFNDFNEEKEVETKSSRTEIVHAAYKESNIDLTSPPQNIVNDSRKIQEEYTLTPELKEFNRKNLYEKLEACKDQEELQHFLNSNASVILSLDEQIKDSLIKEIDNKKF